MAAKYLSRRNAGFTLPELLVTMAVLAILSLIAAPSFRDVLRRSQVSAASNTLLADLTYARSESATRRTFVSICASATGTSCSGEAAYESGWIVYAYPAGDAGANQEYSADDKTFSLLRYTETQDAVAIEGQDGDVVTFGQQGQLRASATHTGTMSFWVCALTTAADRRTAESTAGVHGTQLTVNGSGSLQTTQLSSGDSCSPS
jgi:type IV fimbrial biogenesis protein FimT